MLRCTNFNRLYLCLLHFAFKSFGYVVEGADLLRDVKEGDIIVTATVTSGLENLVLPSKA